MSIKATDVLKSLGDPATDVIRGVSLDIKPGEFVALTGRSGSGKSTLLYMLGTLDNPSGGRIELDGKDIAGLTEEALHQLRNEKIGFVFQFHYLLPELTAIENVLMPAVKAKRAGERRKDAEDLLTTFGLGEKMHRLPRQLSGGEQQRVAIARALIMKPEYLFADEPTGSLDSASGSKVMDILQDINKSRGTTIVLVTHDPDFAAMAKRQVVLADGRIINDSH
jgi:ABC-type lipoprotein export system ATPase subunit